LFCFLEITTTGGVPNGNGYPADLMEIKMGFYDSDYWC